MHIPDTEIRYRVGCSEAFVRAANARTAAMCIMAGGHMRPFPRRPLILQEMEYI